MENGARNISITEAESLETETQYSLVVDLPKNSENRLPWVVFWVLKKEKKLENEKEDKKDRFEWFKDPENHEYITG